MVLLGNRGLETAEANGDTRTLSLHHLHTDENITITYKRDGRYDEEALKKLDHFLRDWRKDESIHMDPRLIDVIWEVSREFGKDKVIDVVCGYRSPATNAMLRRRSRGVAEFSQHTLGKAMDFYIQGVSLEEIREAGLRLQRGGVGYYPTSGSPFVHLDVGSVRHWPRMTREQLARVFSNGRTVHIPSDGQPLSGYSQALADIQKRGSTAPGADASTGSGHSKNLIASLFHTDEEDDDRPEAGPAVSTASKSRPFSLASLSDAKGADSKTESAKADTARAAAARSQRTALAAMVSSTKGGDDGVTGAVPTERDPWATARLPEAPRAATGVPHAPLSNPDGTPSVAPWPFRDADNDRVPLDMVLAYAAEPQRDSVSDSDFRVQAIEREPARAAAPARSVARESSSGGAKKSVARASGSANVSVVKVVVETAIPGMRYNDPWLRALILAPRMYGSMTATPHGDPDLTELRVLMTKPTKAVAMSFTNDPSPGIKANSFSGEAVVQLSIVTFSQRTAMLQQ